MPTIRKIQASRPNIIRRKKVAAYARVSESTEQLLHSLSAQVSHYSRLIQENPEWEYAGVYVDEGISGRSTGKRDEFLRMMADCDAGKIDIILAKSISRFARDTVDCLNAVRHLKDIGVEVRFERENISSLTTDGELLLTLLASFAQAESDSISANIKWATRKRFQEGIPNGHKAPYGYEWDGEMFRIIPEQGRVVRYVYDRYLAGVSGYAIAKELKEMGVKGQSGVPICDSTVKDIVTSISYTGTMVLQKNFFTEGNKRRKNRGELPMYAVEEMFEPLVTVDEHERAQEIRRQRAEESANRNIVFTPFSGIVKCGDCGCSVSRRTSGKRKKWVCNTRERKGMAVCGMRPVQEEELIAAAKKAAGDENFRFERIVIFGDCIEFHLGNGRVKKIPREYGGYKFRNGFSGKVFCGICGSKCERDTWRKRSEGRKEHMWVCSTPRCSCNLKRLPEEELREAAGALLGIENYEGKFVAQVDKAVVYNDRVDFMMKDGTVRKWQRK